MVRKNSRSVDMTLLMQQYLEQLQFASLMNTIDVSAAHGSGSRVGANKSNLSSLAVNEMAEDDDTWSIDVSLDEDDLECRIENDVDCGRNKAEK
jgi:hypothetical protein